MILRHLWIALSLINLLAACTSLPGVPARRADADALAKAGGWHANVVPAGRFDIVTFTPIQFKVDADLAIYIEGDGFAWRTASLASSDPTPLDPLALRLALAHPDGNAAYLARPCQYLDAVAVGCAKRYWTTQRFAPEVIDAENTAVDVLKLRFGAQRIVLVGYSGGGAVAALLAARRDDVRLLVTVAGNLDHLAWTSFHGIQPLIGSLNPAEERISLGAIHQVHYVGAADTVIPPSLVENFVDGYTWVSHPEVVVIPGYDHHCCWAEHWADWVKKWK